MYQPSEVNLSRDEPSVETIQQYYITVNTDQKCDLLVHLLKRDRPRQCIVFTRTKRGADRLADRLRKVVRGVSTIHGDLPQTTRDRVMRAFRSGEITVLVATDVVGRGIDVEDISHVINYDIPDDAENYVHRIGRTGRMGKDGVAYLFVCPDQGEPLTAIENLTNRVIPPLQHRGIQPSPAEDRDRDSGDFQQYGRTASTQPRALVDARRRAEVRCRLARCDFTIRGAQILARAAGLRKSCRADSRRSEALGSPLRSP